MQQTSSLTVVLFSSLTTINIDSKIYCFNAINVISKLQLMQLTCYFELLMMWWIHHFGRKEKMDTSMDQLRETLDIGGSMTQIIWIHQMHAFIRCIVDSR